MCIRDRATLIDDMEQYQILSYPKSDTTKADRYFAEAARETIYNSLDKDTWCMKLEAPTGVGKTTRYTIELLRLCISNKLHFVIWLLEPTRAAAMNAFNRIRATSKANKWDKQVMIKLSMGDSFQKPNQDSWGSGNIQFFIMTAGKAITETPVPPYTQLLPHLVLIDEAHSRHYVTVLQSHARWLHEKYLNLGLPNVENRNESRLILITATDCGITGATQLCAGKPISATLHTIEELSLIQCDPKVYKQPKDYNDPEYIIPVSYTHLDVYKRQVDTF